MCGIDLKMDKYINGKNMESDNRHKYMWSTDFQQRRQHNSMEEGIVFLANDARNN